MKGVSAWSEPWRASSGLHQIGSMLTPPSSIPGNQSMPFLNHPSSVLMQHPEGTKTSVSRVKNGITGEPTSHGGYWKCLGQGRAGHIMNASGRFLSSFLRVGSDTVKGAVCIAGVSFYPDVDISF